MNQRKQGKVYDKIKLGSQSRPADVGSIFLNIKLEIDHFSVSSLLHTG